MDMEDTAEWIACSDSFLIKIDDGQGSRNEQEIKV